MKKITYTIVGLFLLIGSLSVNAQMEMSVQDCTVEYNLFKGDVQQKNFDAAKSRLDNLMTNCPKIGSGLYYFGAKVAKNMIEVGDKDAGIKLYNKVNKTRIELFGSKIKGGLGKFYSDWYVYLLKNGVSDNEIFHLLEQGYKEDPAGVSTKNIERFFNVVLEKNKNVNDQKILDTYDNINDALEVKLDSYQKKLNKLVSKENTGVTLSTKDIKNKKTIETILTNIGSLTSGLDDKIDTFLTCDRLIPLYRKDFDSNRSNGQWLKRAVSKMYHKECTGDALYEELVEAYANAEPSSSSKLFYSRVLEKRGKIAEAKAMLEEAINLETDPTRKSNLLLKTAQDLSRKGKKSEARRKANEALKYNSSNGKAYLLIATMYAKSANNCGTTLFSKRMVYVAALNKARKAASVDPSMASRVKKFTRSYASNIPTTQDAFAEGFKSGDSYKIGCWIGETVRVQVR